MMRHSLPILLLAALIATGCESVREISLTEDLPRDQSSPEGVVRMYSIAVDSGDVDGALRLYCNARGGVLLALERFELRDEAQRLANRIRGREITAMRERGARDSATGARLTRVRVEFGYLFSWTFDARRIDDRWYIQAIHEEDWGEER